MLIKLILLGVSSLAWAMLSILYGLSLEEARGREDIVSYAGDFVYRSGIAAMPGRFLIDVIPALKHLPHFMNPWKIIGEKSYRSDTQFLAGLVNNVRARMVSLCVFVWSRTLTFLPLRGPAMPPSPSART